MDATISIGTFNSLPEGEATELLTKACGAQAWTSAVTEARPFTSKEDLLQKAATIWDGLDQDAWLDAFLYHPKIGDIDSLKKKFSQGKGHSKTEQSGVSQADEAVLTELRQLNIDYENKFGFIFIVFATGKSAAEMLGILKGRIGNDRQTEIKNGADNQKQITNLRLEKMFTE